jgi:membrane-bound metal-dependent hydrolase YbcI (DUF457 family)
MYYFIIIICYTIKINLFTKIYFDNIIILSLFLLILFTKIIINKIKDKKNIFILHINDYQHIFIIYNLQEFIVSYIFF